MKLGFAHLYLALQLLLLKLGTHGLGFLFFLLVIFVQAWERIHVETATIHRFYARLRLNFFLGEWLFDDLLRREVKNVDLTLA